MYLSNMSSTRRPLLLALLFFIVCVTFFRPWKYTTFHPLRWKAAPTEPSTPAATLPATAGIPIPILPFGEVTSQPAIVKPSHPSPTPSSYAALDRVLVVARQLSENVDWIKSELPDVTAAVYVVDDPTAELRVPANKGHEAMVYLTYIVDNYDALPAVSIFVHAHRNAWHNNDLLDSDMVKGIRRLQSDQVQKDGYMNLRCHQQPGCSDNLHLDATKENGHKPEVLIFRKVWSQLHPGDPLPKTLSAPCCAQFAVSRDRVRSIPRARYVAWRDWLLNNDLESRISGRIWEYTWHYIFSGQADLCPSPHHCYCGGFAVCFESAAAHDAWFDLRSEKGKLEDAQKEDENPDDDKRRKERSARIVEMQVTLDKLKAEALERGLVPDLRRKALASSRVS